jgi:hypothetical protein
MNRRRISHLGLALLLLILPARSVAQGTPALPKYGKWVTLVAAVAMGVQAASAHREANDAFDQLQSYCGVDENRCQLGSNGRYVDPVSEGYYQSSLDHDRSARAWLFGGEAALVGSAALFVWELTRPKGPPRNIPFDPQVSVVGGQTRLGLRLWY